MILEMVRSRWIKDRRASYPYEVAWVFDKKEEAVSKIMKQLEQSRDIEPARLGRGKKGPPKPFKLQPFKPPAPPNSWKIVEETGLERRPGLDEGRM